MFGPLYQVVEAKGCTVCCVGRDTHGVLDPLSSTKTAQEGLSLGKRLRPMGKCRRNVSVMRKFIKSLQLQPCYFLSLSGIVQKKNGNELIVSV